MAKKDDMGHMNALLGLGASRNPSANRNPGFTIPAGPNRDPGFTKSVKSLTSMTTKRK